jgi:hypothetical protein
MIKSRIFLPLFLASVLVSSEARVEGGELSVQDYVLGNTLMTLYHEFGHAIVDNLDLRGLGKEEDAADFFSILIIENKLTGSVLTQK